VLFVAMLARAQAPQQAPAQAVDPLLQQADAALNKKDYAAATQALETYLAKNPADYRAEFNLAYAYSLMGRRAEAIAHYQNVIAREPDLIPARLNAGILLLEAGSAEESAADLRVVVEKEPENVTAIFYLAESLAALKRVAEAGDAYERVLRKKPDDARAHLGYGRLLEASNPAKAEEHLRKAAELDPSLDEASLRLAALVEARASGNPDALREPASIYQRYLEKHPERADLRIRLGEIYLAQKQFAAAAVELEKARAAGDTSLSVAKSLLNAYLNEDDAERSEKLKSIPEFAPDSVAKSATKFNEKAVALVRELLIREPKNSEMHLLYGRLHMEKREYREAAGEFQQVTSLQPQSPDGYRNLASALFLMREYPGTVDALEKISELKQDNAGTYFIRAISLDKLHIRRAAFDNYQNFLKSDAGKNPDQEFQARTRSRILDLEIKKGMGGRK
jgi:tetratricopeptide (TPR) repeat protein